MCSSSKYPRQILLATLSSLIMLGACSSGNSNTPTPGAIAFSISPTSATVPQGGSTQVAGTITRSGGFTGDVNVALVNPPAGVTGTLTTPPINGSSSAVATLSVSSSVPVGAYTLSVQATGTGVSSVTQQFTLTVVAAPGLSLAGTPATVSVAQAASASTGVKATRSGGLTGTISYASSGAPAGLGIVIASTDVADSSSVTVTATPFVATGAYPIVITGTSGAAGGQVTITVTVTPTVAMDFSACASADKPIWVASQDGNGAWVHLVGTDDVYRVPVFTSGKGAVATVTQSSLGDATFYYPTVRYVAQSELAALTPCTAPATGKTIHGTTAGLSGSDQAEIAMGGGSTGVVTAASPTFQLTHVPDGLQDLTGYKLSGDHNRANDRIIIRRDQNIADGGNVALMDFASAEAFAPVTATLTVTGGAVNSYYPTGKYLVGANCAEDTLNFSNNGVPSPFTIGGVPSSQQRATDFHNVVLLQLAATDQRTVSYSFHTVANLTIAIGAGIGPLTTNDIPGSSYRRLQAIFTLASDYTSASLTYSSSGQGSVGVFTVTQSAGYLGAATTVTLTPPDLSAVDGFQTIWGPSTTGTLTYTVAASSTPPPTMCAEGATIRTASKSVGVL